MKNKIKRLVVTSSLLFSSIGLGACSKIQAQACYRLTDLGAKMANEASLLKTGKKKKALHAYKAWGVYPKEVDGETVDINASDEEISTIKGEYKANQVVDTTKTDLPLSITYSETQAPGLDTLFLIGNHKGSVIEKKGALDENAESVILYPSTTLSNEELANYDLDATWTSDESKHLDTSLFNTEQKTVVNYKLVDNSGVLSKDKNTIETNLHFTVNLKNEQVPEGACKIVEDIPYKTPIDQLVTRLEGSVLNSYTSVNPQAELTVKFVKDENETEKKLSDWETEKTNYIEEAKKNKKFSEWTFSFVVSDSDGNKTPVQEGYFRRSDDVAPVIKKNGEVVSELKIGDGKGIQLCSKEVFIKGAAALAKEEGYTFEDEIFGEIEPQFSRNEKGQLAYTYVDGVGNSKECTDESLFIKNFKANDTWQTLDIDDLRFDIINYGAEDQIIKVKYITNDDDYYYYQDELKRTTRKIFILEPKIVNKNTCFEDVITPTEAYNLYFPISNVAGDIIILNTPLTIDCQIISAAEVQKSAALKVFISKDVDIKALLSYNYGYADYYMEGNEREMYENRTHYWYGEKRLKSHYNVYWNQTLTDFKTKFGIQ